MDSAAVTSPDKIIEDIGGCGRFQVRIGITVHGTKMLVAFSVMGTILMSATPTWWCITDVSRTNWTSCVGSANETLHCYEKKCYVNGTKCTEFNFGEGARTVVSEFELLCGLDYIPSTVMSLQTFGMLIGALTAGQLSDLFGRKPPYFTSLVCLIIFNFIGFMSVNWIMFAVSRLFIGIGAGMFSAIQHCIVAEFSLAQWRAWITGFPSEPIHSCVFALVAWLIQDWRYIQLFCCLLGLPLLLTWFIVPESFRWYIAHDRLDDAKNVISRVAKFNKRPTPELETIGLPSTARTIDKRYTYIHLFQSKQLAKVTLLLSINWLALGLVFYGLSFAIQALTGNIYLNLFLFSIVAIPAKFISLWLQNRVGRRFTSIVCFIGVSICGFVVGVVQYVGSCGPWDKNSKSRWKSMHFGPGVAYRRTRRTSKESNTAYRDTLTNMFAILTCMAITTAWGPVQTTTIEIYPTVIRNIGFGSLSVIARLGAVVGPQFVYLNTYVPGLLFFVCGGIAILCIVSQIFLPETRDANLSDKLHQTQIEMSPLKHMDKGQMAEKENAVD